MTHRTGNLIFTTLLGLFILAVSATVYLFGSGPPHDLVALIWEHRNTHLFHGLLAYGLPLSCIAAPIAAWFD